MTYIFNDREPVYIQIAEHIKAVLASGEIGPGSRVPSVRELAAGFGVNPNTVQKALKELESSGYLFSERTSGRFITDDVDKLQELKSKIPGKLVKKFIADMAALGIEKNDLPSYVEKFL